MNSDLIRCARAFAIRAHDGQLRKYTGEPYFNHCEAVANLVGGTPDNTEEMIAAAFLHDTIEDCGISVAQIEAEFGFVVAVYVARLTDVSRPEDGNRAARKAKDRQYISGAPPEVQTIKLADLIDNSRSILERDPKFAVVYLEEKRLLLEVLREGDPTLYEMACRIVREGRAALGIR